MVMAVGAVGRRGETGAGLAPADALAPACGEIEAADEVSAAAEGPCEPTACRSNESPLLPLPGAEPLPPEAAARERMAAETMPPDEENGELDAGEEADFGGLSWLPCAEEVSPREGRETSMNRYPLEGQRAVAGSGCEAAGGLLVDASCRRGSGAAILPLSK